MNITEYTLISINKKTKEQTKNVKNIEENIEIDKKNYRYLVKIEEKEGYFIYKENDILNYSIEISKPFKGIQDIQEYEYIEIETYNEKLKEYEEEQERLRKEREELEKEKEKEKEQEQNTEREREE